MYKLKKKFKQGDRVLLTKSFEGVHVIFLDNPTQKQLKHLYELGVDYITKDQKDGKETNK